ncbi:MAG: hypothetical protein AAGI15_13425 [Pseudomonadota bacterium]
MTVRLALALLAAFTAGLATAWWLGMPQHSPSLEPLAPASAPMEQGRPAATNTERRAAPTSNTNGLSLTSLSAIRALESEFEQNLALLRLIEHDDADALIARLDEAQRALTGSDYVAATSMILTRLSELAPTAALEYILDHPGFAQRAWISAVFFAWARRDLPASRAAIDTLPGGLARVAGEALLRAREDLGGRERRALAAELRLGAVPLSATASFSDAWAQAQAAGNPGARAQQLQQVLRSWASSDPEAALAAVSQLDNPQLKQGLTFAALDLWARSDARSATLAILNQTDLPQRDALLSRAMAQFADADLPGAMTLLAEAPASRQDSLRLGLVNALAKNDPGLLNQWLTDSESAQFKESAYHRLLSPLATGNGSADLSWIEGLPPVDALKAETMAISYLAAGDPQRAAQRIDDLPEGPTRNNAMVRLASQWSGANPEDAVAWHRSLPAEAQARTLPTLAANWAERDFAGASRYLDGVRDAEVRQSARMNMIRHAQNAGQVDEILRDLSDPTIRRIGVMRAFDHLQRIDPVSARRYEAEAEAAREAQILRSNSVRTRGNQATGSIIPSG